MMHSYNNSYHRTIKMTPNQVNNDNEKKIRKIMYYSDNTESSKINYMIGDLVRISKLKGSFEKGYTRNWTREIFVIYKVLARNPIVFKIKDLNGEVIEGVFYNEELQKILKPEQE